MLLPQWGTDQGATGARLQENLKSAGTDQGDNAGQDSGITTIVPGERG